jgi:hypothetical protein
MTRSNGRTLPERVVCRPYGTRFARYSEPRADALGYVIPPDTRAKLGDPAGESPASIREFPYYHDAPHGGAA